MALTDFFEGRHVIRITSRINGLVESETDYEPKTPDDTVSPGRWESILSFANAHPHLFDIEFADTPLTDEPDKKGLYNYEQLKRMAIPKLNKVLAGFNLSGMPDREAAIKAILEAQGSR